MFKSFVEFVQFKEEQFLENKDYPIKDKEYWDKYDKEQIERKKIEDELMAIAKSNFNSALDLANTYESLDDAIASYAQNAEDTARELRFDGNDQMAAYQLVYNLYNDYKAKLKSQKKI